MEPQDQVAEAVAGVLVARSVSVGTFRVAAPGIAGRGATLHTRFRRWALDGTLERMLQAAQAKADAAGDIDWLVSVDPTVVRAHQHAAGARKWGSAAPRPDAPGAA